jgi:hypothetical protein
VKGKKAPSHLDKYANDDDQDEQQKPSGRKDGKGKRVNFADSSKDKSSSRFLKGKVHKKGSKPNTKGALKPRKVISKNGKRKAHAK